MLKIFAHKKRRASILDLSQKSLSNPTTTTASSIYTAATSIHGDESPIIHVPKKHVPVNSSSPILVMPKPKHAIPPTQGVLDPGDKDKTELEEQQQQPAEERVIQDIQRRRASSSLDLDDRVEALQRQVYMIQQQRELERAQWKQREQEHRLREREMMEKICQTQDQLRMALAGNSRNSNSRPPSRPRSTLLPMDEQEDMDYEIPLPPALYAAGHHNRRGCRHQRPMPSPHPRRNSATSIHSRHYWSSPESDYEEEEEEDQRYSFSPGGGQRRHYPRPRPSESTPQQRRARRPVSYYCYH
ncbi:predicted protein [Lichtheimia corymbifera JMRC:FSU:9682]|uniref:Uncharacterized protein n=1 Tax=Lichtheimia corymbifera JMRC:FSU:9682 TaxID=1263082 RepID=A0A068RSY6_9FUNG|nr:predicted protein [Lichtheimia corymbifera JMRC:FSU:9682]